ncbi:hypothetical protein [Delftia sp.]|uniref:hypothetical protein n=1 Tax=Delftia sp. TaxID=1886637 RepID=UPI00257F7C81|nr:hypothetical protein [Delftia sp.]MPT55007.1 hypothetical protein [Delftia sp.]
MNWQPTTKLDFTKPLQTIKGEPVKWIVSDVIEHKCARVCVDENTGLVYSSPYIGLRIVNAPTDGITDEMIDAYMSARRRVIEAADSKGLLTVGWLQTGIAREACRKGLRAAIDAQTAKESP